MDYKIILIGVLSFISLLFIILTIIFISKNKKKQQKITEIINNKFNELENIYKQKEEELERGLAERYNNSINNYNLQIEAKHKEFKQLDETLEATRKSALTQCEDYKAAEMARVESEITTHRIIKARELDEDLKRKKEDRQKKFDEFVENIISKEEQIKNEYEEIVQILEDFRKRREVVNSQILREKEAQENTDFYRICISDEDKNDLQLIKEIESRFNNKEVLHKAAYDCYIKRPAQEMIKRVTEGNKISGIYCITYIPTGEMYIGRSTDIANRWGEHTKAAFSLGSIAHSSLHTKMARDGIWNFTFQILEKVDKEKLNEREKYWINVYGSTVMLNQKQGG